MSIEPPQHGDHHSSHLSPPADLSRCFSPSGHRPQNCEGNRIARALPQLGEAASQMLCVAEDLDRRLRSTLGEDALHSYVVGGFVRDAFRGATPRDLDVQVVGNWERISKAVLESGLVRNPVLRPIFSSISGVANGEISIDIHCTSQVQHESLDVHMARQAALRGYSVNSLYYDLRRYRVIDLFGGIEDLRKGELRLLPRTSVVEDPRLLFSGFAYQRRFDFKFDKETERTLSLAAQELALRWSDQRVPVQIARAVNRLAARRIDLVGLAADLGKIGYFDQFCNRLGVDPAGVTESLSRIALAPPVEGVAIRHGMRRGKFAAKFGRILATRGVDQVDVVGCARIAEVVAHGFGFCSRSVGGSIRELQLSNRIRAIAQQPSLQIELRRVDSSNQAIASKRIESPPPQSRLAHVVSFARALRSRIGSTGEDVKVFIYSKRFLAELAGTRDAPFVLMVGSDPMHSLSLVARFFDVRISKRHRDVAVFDRPGGAITVIHFPTMPVGVEGEDCLGSVCVPSKLAQARLVTASGAFVDLSSGQAYIMHRRGVSSLPPGKAALG